MAGAALTALKTLMTVQLSPAPLAPLALTAWLRLFAAALLARLVSKNNHTALK